jgi:hypothetical protein
MHPVAKVDTFVPGVFLCGRFLIGEQIVSSVWFVSAPEELRGGGP